MVNSVNIAQEIQKSYLEYSLSVIIGRAIPEVRDGLKPVHRRILFAMHELGNTYNRAYKKSARVVGDVIGKYHPHGDSAVYDALVRMAQSFSMRDILVDGQGNFGSIDGDAPAAMRYTEVRMARLTGEFLADIEKETVDFKPNYDNTVEEPIVLPTKVPNLLLNGSSGIAVGMATNIPPHNLGELVQGVLLMLDNPNCTISELMQYINGPDFPTGATIFAGKGLIDAYTTGRGSIRIRGTIEVEERSKGLKVLVVKDIPYGINKSSLVKKIADLINERRIDGIVDLRDESDRKGIRVVMDLRKGTIPEIIINALYKFTPLENPFGINMMAVVGNRPRLLSLKQMLLYFLDHRREVITRRTRYDLRKSKERLHILEGLRVALDNIDVVIALIRVSVTSVEAKGRLIDRFCLSAVQSQAILDMRLQRLTNLEREKIFEEYAEMLRRIEYFRSILENDAVLCNVIRMELTELADTFANPRKSKICLEEVTDIEVEDLLPDYEVVLTLSRRGYIKRTALDVYQTQRRGGKGIAGVLTAEDDYIQNLLITSNHQYLCFFTNRGRMYQLKAWQVPEAGRTAKGQHIANLLPLEKGEYAAASLTLREFQENRYFLFITRKGMVKRSSMNFFSNCRRSGLQAVGLRSNDELLMVCVVNDDAKVILVTRLGYAIHFHLSDVRPTGRIASGVRGINLRSDDAVSAAVIANDPTRHDILTISACGYGKRSSINLYREQARGGKGIINMKITQRTGVVIGAIMVNDEDELVLLTSGNKIIRTNINEINIIGRATQGVRVVKLEQNQQALSFDLVR